jgi:hypothetical protein
MRVDTTINEVPLKVPVVWAGLEVFEVFVEGLVLEPGML